MLFDRRTEEALDTCDRALRSMPRIIELLCVRAGALLDLGYPELALAHLDSAIDMDPNNGDLTVERCRAYIELGNLKDAHEDLTNLYQNFQDDPEVVYLLAIVEELGGNLPEADRLYNVASDIAPNRYSTPLRVKTDWLEQQVRAMVSDVHGSLGEQLETVETKVMPIPPPNLWARSYQGVPPTILGVMTSAPLGHDGIASASARTTVQFLFFQRNIERTARTVETLLTQLRKTIQHEIRHFLEGEDFSPTLES